MSIDEAQIEVLVAKRQAAEKAVEGADPAIKEKAFEVVLQHLLAADAHPVASKRTRRRKTNAAESGKQRAPARARRGSGPQSHLRDLTNDGFFDKARDLPAIVQQLRVVGHIYKQPQLSTPLRRLTQARVLRRRQEEREGGRKVWVYERQE